MFSEIKRRETEALRLYEALPHLEPFHASRAPDRMIRAGNRSSKTMSAAVEFARAVMGCDPYDKYPKKDGSAIIVGLDMGHLSDPLYRILFRPGAIRMIEENGHWVAYKPWIHGPNAVTKPAGPLIPRRMVEDEYWYSKKGSIPKHIILRNGWEIRWYSSEGKPPQGIRIHLAWFDEEITDPTWYPEVAARLVDYRGYFIWSATAQKGGLQFYELGQEAERQASFTVPRVVEFTSHINQNPYFTNEQRELFFGKLSEEEFRIRVDGEYAFTTYKVFPEFDEYMHTVPDFEVPPEWMRGLVVDPGRQVCAVLFVAVPPPTHKDSEAIYFYDELYLEKCSAKIFAAEVRRKGHQQEFDFFLMDAHGGQLRDIGSGESIEFQYAMALKDQNMRCRRTGHRFLYDTGGDIKAGLEKARSWLHCGPTGTPKLRVLKHACPKFLWEIRRYHYKKDRNGSLTDEPDQRHNHMMDNFRYAAMFDPHYTRPKQHLPSVRIAEYVKKKKLKRFQEEGGSGLSLGAGGSAKAHA